MNDSIFRKKSVDRISSPEESLDYLRVTKPAIWMILVAIVFILIAIAVWSITGKIEENILVDNKVVTVSIAPIKLLFD